MQEIEVRLFSEPLSKLIERLERSRRLTRLADLLQRRSSEHSVNLDAAAATSGVEKNHLNFLLRTATGFTFHQLLIRFRLLRAVELLDSTSLSMAEVADFSGFGSLSSFERNFSRVFHYPPRDYRKSFAGRRRYLADRRRMGQATTPDGQRRYRYSRVTPVNNQ